MRAKPLAGSGWTLLFCAMAVWLTPRAAVAQSMPSSNLDAPTVPVYVTDFELASLPNGKQGGAATAPPPATAAKTDGSPEGRTAARPEGVLVETDTPSTQARKLMDLFSLTLAQTLQKNNYTVTNPAAGRPNFGVMLRGVFAEIDPTNHVRKAVLGTASTSPQFVLYVGSFNLGQPDQALYQASASAPDSRYGPVITLNSYVPMVKFDLSKNPTADDVRSICAQIVSNLTGLIKANPEAFQP